MNYSEFFQKFYFSRKEGGLIGYKSQKRIPEFFVTFGLDAEYHDDKLERSDSSYERWFRGTEAGKTGRNPDNVIWAALINHFDSDKLLKELLKALNETKLRELMARFDIVLQPGDVADKRRFANAIVAQFEAIAAGNGSAENIVPAEYKKTPEAVGYEAYLRGAVDKFKAMRLPNEDEYLLNEFFVCNNIGTAAVVYPHRNRGNFIENATMEKIRTFDPRVEVWCALIIGACGYGKTLMLQHLFLEAAEKRSETGYLPVFAELRHFSARHKSFIEFLVETMKEYDPGITQENVIELLTKGQMQILLDGLDEMDPEETNNFQRKLGEFRQHYPSNQIIISSRQCAAISGIRNCVKLYLHPLDETQSKELIEKLLQGDEEGEAVIASFMEPDKGYIQKNGFIATNPMLLTIMVRNRERLVEFHGDKLKFYEMMYDALIRQHDEEKQAFGRFFHSVYDGDEFTQVFREFCAKSYLDRVHRFDHRSFEKYFLMVRRSVKLQNPSKFQLRAFQQDVCATSCMMYEQESGFFYIDPGFQDYFFAEYYYFADTDPTRELGKSLWNTHPDPNRNLDAFMMFNRMAPEKTEVCFFLPYLDAIFKGQNDDGAFKRFLSLGFRKITYTIFDKALIERGKRLSEAEEHSFYLQPMNNPNVMLTLLFNVLMVEPRTDLIMEKAHINSTGDPSFAMIGYPFKGSAWSLPEERGLTIFRTEMHDIHQVDTQEFREMFEYPLYVDDNGKPICFGYSYTVDPLKVDEGSEQFNEISQMCVESGIMDAFHRLKEYYKTISEVQETNEYR